MCHRCGVGDVDRVGQGVVSQHKSDRVFWCHLQIRLCRKNIWPEKPDDQLAPLLLRDFEVELVLLDMVILIRLFLSDVFPCFLHVDKLLVFITSFGKEFHISSMPYWKGYHLGFF